MPGSWTPNKLQSMKKYIPWTLFLLTLAAFIWWVFIPAGTPQQPLIVPAAQVQEHNEKYQKELEKKLVNVEGLLSKSRDNNKDNEVRMAALNTRIKELLKLKPIQKAIANSDTVGSVPERTVVVREVPVYSDHTAQDYTDLADATLEHIQECDSSIAGLKTELTWQETKAELYRQQYNGARNFLDTALGNQVVLENYTRKLEKSLGRKKTESTIVKILVAVAGVLYLLKK